MSVLDQPRLTNMTSSSFMLVIIMGRLLSIIASCHSHKHLLEVRQFLPQHLDAGRSARLTGRTRCRRCLLTAVLEHIHIERAPTIVVGNAVAESSIQPTHVIEKW